MGILQEKKENIYFVPIKSIRSINTLPTQAKPNNPKNTPFPLLLTNKFHFFTTNITPFQADIAYMDAGKGREQNAVALNTRCRRCAQVIPLFFAKHVSASLTCSINFLLPLPRCAGVTKTRCLLFGARTPWYHTPLA